MSWWTHFLEQIGVRKAEQETVSVGHVPPYPMPGPRVAPAMPAPYIPEPVPVGVTIAPLTPIPTVSSPAPSAPPAPPVVVPPPEFSTHADGSVWWRDPVRGVEMGPCASLQDAINLRDAVAARDWAQDPRNPESQQATADVPGLGFPVMPKAQVDVILANFDAAIAGGHEDKAWFQLTSQEHFALQNRGVKRVDINAMINKYNK